MSCNRIKIQRSSSCGSSIGRKNIRCNSASRSDLQTHNGHICGKVQSDWLHGHNKILRTLLPIVNQTSDFVTHTDFDKVSKTTYIQEEVKGKYRKIRCQNIFTSTPRFEDELWTR